MKYRNISKMQHTILLQEVTPVDIHSYLKALLAADLKVVILTITFCEKTGLNTAYIITE